MSKLPWVVALLSVVWFGVCWQWYVCGVKAQCGVQVVEVTKEVIKVVEVTKPVPAPALATTTVPATTTPATPPQPCADYLTGYIEYGADNNPDDVWKLKQFLRDYQDATISDQRGVYDFVTFEAVKDFQLKYQQDILAGQDLVQPTGYVYTATQRKINELHCAAQNN